MFKTYFCKEKLIHGSYHRRENYFHSLCITNIYMSGINSKDKRHVLFSNLLNKKQVLHPALHYVL